MCLNAGQINMKDKLNPLNWKEEMITLQRAAIEYGEIYNLFKQKKVGDDYEQTAWSKLAKSAKRFIDSNPPDYML